MKLFKVVKSITDEMTNSNCIFMNKIFETEKFVKIGPKKIIYKIIGSNVIKNNEISINKIQRLSSECYLRKEINLEFYTPPKNKDIKSLKFSIYFDKEIDNKLPNVDGKEVLEILKKMITEHFVVYNQQIGLLYKEKWLIVNIEEIELFDYKDLSGTNRILSNFGRIVDETIFNLKINKKSKIKGINIPETINEDFLKLTDFKSLGIGGLNKELQTIYRRAFISRIYPHSIIKKFGIQHVKGIILYGPPGTGKTLIARKIGEILNTHPPKIINGPEILNKYIGESEKAIRDCFRDAEIEYEKKGDKSKLHLIIFDEIDAICKSRGTNKSGTGVNDSIINQLLSKMDGVNQINNILIIGMTNRLDLLDNALLRSGRFEVKIEINLPNKTGRKQIFEIHTKKMKENKVLGNDFNLDKLVELTENYSGAEIANLIRSAVSFALNENVDFNNISKSMKKLINLSNKTKIKMKDFLNSLNEVKPSYGVSKKQFYPYLKNKLLNCGKNNTLIQNNTNILINKLKKSKKLNLLSLLYRGKTGTGKTSLAVNIACNSNYSFIKMISPNDTIGFTDSKKINYIVNIFEQAYKSKLSIIIIDDIKRIVNYHPNGSIFSNSILQSLTTLIKKNPPNNNKLLIIVTTSITENILDINSTFDYILNFTELNRFEIKEIIRSVIPKKKKIDFKKYFKHIPYTIGIKDLLKTIELLN